MKGIVATFDYHIIQIKTKKKEQTPKVKINIDIKYEPSPYERMEQAANKWNALEFSMYDSCLEREMKILKEMIYQLNMLYEIPIPPLKTYNF